MQKGFSPARTGNAVHEKKKGTANWQEEMLMKEPCPAPSLLLSIQETANQNNRKGKEKATDQVNEFA